jgi:hypothetical protein
MLRNGRHCYASILSALIIACSTLAQRHEVYGTDGPSGDDEVWVVGTRPPVASEWSLATWPELGAVDSATFGEALDPVHQQESTLYLRPATPFEARRYVVRWRGSPRADEHVDGIPLRDGSVVSPFYGHTVLEVRNVTGWGTGYFAVRFNAAVVPDALHTPSDVVTVSQPGATCAAWFSGGPPLLGQRCGPRPLHVTGLESACHDPRRGSGFTQWCHLAATRPRRDVRRGLGASDGRLPESVGCASAATRSVFRDV